MDLHCCTLDEAKKRIVTRVLSCVEYIRQKKSVDEIVFDVVTGKHSHVNACASSNLQYEVRKYLQEQNITFKPGDNPGCVRVFVNRNTSIQ